MPANPSPPNVLMISIDDLRPLLGCYGHPQMQTPNFDRLASSGVRFSRAFCNVPVCGASRASLLTGLRPRPDRFVTYHASADEDAPGVVTLPEVIKAQGYVTAANQKIFHHGDDHRAVWDQFFDSQLPQFPGPYYDEENKRQFERYQGQRKPGVKPWIDRGGAWECVDVRDEDHKDGEAVVFAIERLQQYKHDGSRFLLGYGSINVHLPFKAPKRYWDLYDPAAIRLPPHGRQPEDVPAQALHDFGELRNYTGIPDEGPVDDETARSLIHGYMAGVSYLDAQIGRLLDELDRLDLADSTMVVLWVDHGFNLGEHGLWCKHCLYETSLHVPLIIRPDRGTAEAQGIRAGTVVDDVVENLDVYPTVCELMGIAPPDHLQGRSLVSKMRDPSTKHEGAAISRYFAGDSIRTDRYRYAEWVDDAGEVSGRTLFDLHDDPDELTNLADDAAHAGTVRSLSERLHGVIDYVE